ncbi:carboxypeptidase regulatory-like domain-containing protein [Acidobacteria bacterium AH-259-D05]|nr:carboxypeptidase regulatory-like domain-containing protein [Acidobacteria bacterium AH-259-D05]
MNWRNMIKKLVRSSLAVGSLGLLLAVSLMAVDLKDGGVLTGKIELTRAKKEENLIVYLRGIKGQFEPPQQEAVMDQKDKTFVPHLLPAQRGQKVRFRNSDPFSHNVHLYWGKRSMFNAVQGIEGKPYDWTAKRTGENLVLCDIHREMSAFVLVIDHPFFATVDPQGSGEFRIENIPEGTYTLVVVRDVKGKLKEQEQEVRVKAGQETTVTMKL